MMDRYCEFCVNLRSVVYCKADAAYLCLSCDNKVHSANPLSNRHHRTLICDTCRRRPTYVRCYDHHKFMCHACDLSQHNDITNSQHQKRVMNSYVGCPSARDLGVLWGFDLNGFVDASILNPANAIHSSSASANTSVGCLETDVHIKEMDGSIQASFILQQLVDLLRVQTSDRISSFIRCEEHNNNKVKTEKEDVDQQLVLLGVDDHTIPNPNPNPCCLSPFTQLESQTHLQEDSIWQCKTRIPSSQLWTQNMQDLGVCAEEPSCLDDLNIPDIDLTFRNFEELFKIEQDPIDQDTFISTFVTNTKSSPKKARYTSRIMSLSRSSPICIHSGISHSIEPHESVTLGGKKKIQLIHSKQGHCCYRKARSHTRKRTKSQSWKFKSHERSC